MSQEIKEVERLREKVRMLSAPVTDEEWKQFAYDVRIATPTNFIHAQMMEFHQLENLISSRVMNATLAQTASPIQENEKKDLREAADPFIRAYKVGHPWHDSKSDQEPLRKYLPGAWPLWGEYKKLIRLIEEVCK